MKNIFAHLLVLNCFRTLLTAKEKQRKLTKTNIYCLLIKKNKEYITVQPSVHSRTHA
jgi:hypothetical protein